MLTALYWTCVLGRFLSACLIISSHSALVYRLVILKVVGETLLRLASQASFTTPSADHNFQSSRLQLSLVNAYQSQGENCGPDRSFADVVDGMTPLKLQAIDVGLTRLCPRIVSLMRHLGHIGICKAQIFPPWISYQTIFNHHHLSCSLCSTIYHYHLHRGAVVFARFSNLVLMYRKILLFHNPSNHQVKPRRSHYFL